MHRVASKIANAWKANSDNNATWNPVRSTQSLELRRIFACVGQCLPLKLPDDFIPFLKMYILSLDSSTLPSASMTPGRLRWAAGTSGELTAATPVRRRTSGGEVSRRLAVCRDGLPLSSIARGPRCRAQVKKRSVSEPSPATRADCHPPARPPIQQLPILLCEPEPHIRPTVKQIRIAALFMGDLSAPFPTLSVSRSAICQSYDRT